MIDKTIEILIRVIKEIDKLRGFTFYKEQFKTPPFVTDSEIEELYSLLNNNKMPKEQKNEMVFEDVVKKNMEATQDLWKVIAILLKDVNELQKKFKEIEEVETKSV